MLNPTKPYYQTAKFLKDNSVSKKTLINERDKVWNLVTKVIPEDHIFYHNWTSFSNIHSEPTAIRIRDDKFLVKTLENKLRDTFAIFSCIKINGTKLYFVMTSNYFTNYCYKTTSSNSFICWDLKDLYEWVKNPDQIIQSERRVKRKGDQPIYQFWVGTDKVEDFEQLKQYLEILSHIRTTNYSILNRYVQDEARVSIPKDVSDGVKFRYDGICALLKNHKCEYSNENPSVFTKVKRHEHHIVPRKWFDTCSTKKVKFVNNSNNLILLCNNCHDKLHGKDPLARKHTLDSIIECMKQINIYDNFVNYLQNDLNITLPILYRIYGVDYD